MCAFPPAGKPFYRVGFSAGFAHLARGEPTFFTIITGWIASKEESQCLLILASLVFLFFSFRREFREKKHLFSVFLVCVSSVSHHHRSCELLLLYGR